jgi:alanyl-tRNA synthetase
VRVVLIGDYDAATCAHAHAKSTKEAALFAVEDLHSLSGHSYEIAFVTGPEAIRYLGAMTLDRAEAARHLHARHDDLAEASAKSESEISELKRTVRELTSKLFEGLAPSNEVEGTQIYARCLGRVSEKTLLSEVGRATGSGKRLYIIGYEEGGSRMVVVARSPVVNLDCAELLSQVLGEMGGKGGGRRNFAIGGGGGVEPARAVERIALAARRQMGEKP